MKLTPRQNIFTFAALMTCLPLPFPSEAPSMIPGKSSTWISAPPYSRTPGIAVRVVNEYAATAAFVFVIFERKVDLPTEGNPTSAIRASPLLLTSKPVPPLEPAPAAGSRSWARRRASFLIWMILLDNGYFYTSEFEDHVPFQETQVILFKQSNWRPRAAISSTAPVALFFCVLRISSSILSEVIKQ